jgi:hypothetical protein
LCLGEPWIHHHFSVFFFNNILLVFKIISLKKVSHFKFKPNTRKNSKYYLSWHLKKSHFHGSRTRFSFPINANFYQGDKKLYRSLVPLPLLDRKIQITEVSWPTKITMDIFLIRQHFLLTFYNSKKKRFFFLNVVVYGMWW